MYTARFSRIIAITTNLKLSVTFVISTLSCLMEIRNRNNKFCFCNYLLSIYINRTLLLEIYENSYHMSKTSITRIKTKLDIKVINNKTYILVLEKTVDVITDETNDS